MKIIGVHKAFIHSGKGIKHRPKTKKRYKVFYYDDEADKFGAFYTDPLSAMAFKLQKCRRRTFTCLVCGSKSIIFYRTDKDARESKCFACGTSIGDHLEAIEEAFAESS